MDGFISNWNKSISKRDINLFTSLLDKEDTKVSLFLFDSNSLDKETIRRDFLIFTLLSDEELEIQLSSSDASNIKSYSIESFLTLFATSPRKCKAKWLDEDQKKVETLYLSLRKSNKCRIELLNEKYFNSSHTKVIYFTKMFYGKTELNIDMQYDKSKKKISILSWNCIPQNP